MYGEEGKEVSSSREESKPVIETKKIDVSKLISIIPPASQLRRKEARIREKRIRIRYDESMPTGTVRLSKGLADMLSIKDGDLVDIVVAGRHKFVYKAIVVEEGGLNEAYCNPEELRERGVADNSIATVRRRSGGE